ncbi:DNA polymerase V [Amphibacillus marinus]|uniref:DNA polymerase V n=1 Tax=Amphibacillus marinus TaxID=872970 RepID=A0A1H8LE82_9BACI|nr:Y-family DNA polymerase [Amphibacillus marinus]SEO03096.1 DNA polymerase V [Amphibacillus marinus]
MFDYTEEKSEDILCIDVKSFYASAECVARGDDPMETMLVVMSNAENAGGLILAASPKAKETLGISNVSRKWEIPDHPDLIIVPPRMNFYIEMNMRINNIYRQYVPDEDIHIYSIDETFLSIRPSIKLFKQKSAFALAKLIQTHIEKALGLYLTIGIGDNMLLAKLALDNAAKHTMGYIAEWRYQDVPQTVWQIPNLTDMWGVGSRTAARLNQAGIYTVYDLAHYDFYQLRQKMGLIGEQLYAGAWGIDRSNIREQITSIEKSYGNSQILPRDYLKRTELNIVIREIAEQVATRLRKHHCQTACVSLYVGYSRHELERGFAKQVKIAPTSHSKKLAQYCLELFNKHYGGQAVRKLGISYSKLTYTESIQLDLFEDPHKQLAEARLDFLVDKIREKYGFCSLIHASSLLDGATAVSRSSLVGGHAGGMEGIR